MKCPNYIQTEDQFKDYCIKHGYTNSGNQGWFDDYLGNLHFIYNKLEPTKEDMRIYDMSVFRPVDYYNSEYFLMKPENLLQEMMIRNTNGRLNDELIQQEVQKSNIILAK
jgi:hypothetical protein